MEQLEQSLFIQMVNHTMVFIARRFLIPAALQFVVITRYYASLRLAGNKNQRTLNSIQLRFLGSKQSGIGIKPDWYTILYQTTHGNFNKTANRKVCKIN
jgi:hypothetical protein